MSRGRCLAGLGLLLLALSAACGTALYETKLSFSEAQVAQVRRGSAALGCHERSSELFAAFFICPERKRALGIAQAEGKLLISCPDLGRQMCRRFFTRVREAGATKAAEH